MSVRPAPNHPGFFVAEYRGLAVIDRDRKRAWNRLATLIWRTRA